MSSEQEYSEGQAPDEGEGDAAEPVEASAVLCDPAQLLDRLTAHLAECDRAAAVQAAVEAVTSGSIGIERLYCEVLSPLLQYADGSGAVVWERYLAAAAVRSIVEILYPGVLSEKAAVRPTGRWVVLACPPEERDDLTLRMLSDRFDMAGWSTAFLGAGASLHEITAAVRHLAADAVVFTASTHLSRLTLRRAVLRLHEEFPDLRIWVGGHAFVGLVADASPTDLIEFDDTLSGVGPLAPELTERDEGFDAPGLVLPGSSADLEVLELDDELACASASGECASQDDERASAPNEEDAPAPDDHASEPAAEQSEEEGQC